MNMPSSYAQHLARQPFAMISTGNGLGVMISTPENDRFCPPGWVFINSLEKTPELIQEALDAAKAGRPSWPTKEEAIGPIKKIQGTKARGLTCRDVLGSTQRHR